MKLFLAFFLSFMIVFTSTTSAFASVGSAWTVKEAIMDGATATITAIQNKGGTALKSVIAHKPKAAALAKDMVKGGGALAIAFALSELVGVGVEWVLDPANNRIKYKDSTAGGGVTAPNGATPLPSDADYVFYDPRKPSVIYSSRYEACQAINATISGGTLLKFHHFNSETGSCVYSLADGSNPSYGMDEAKRLPTAGDGGAVGNKEKYISLDDVATKILSNAEAGHADSQDFVKAVAVGQAAAGELEAGLDAAAEPDIGTDEGTDEGVDTSGIIAAINAVKAVLAGLVASVGSLADFFTGETPPSESDTSIDIQDIPATPKNVDISFGGGCPADVVIPISFVGQTVDFRFSWQGICNAAVTIKPVVIMIASMSYIFIVSGNRESD